VEVKAYDLKGESFNFTAEGRRAVVLQHEIDHLNGILFFDHISRLKRELYLKKLSNAQKKKPNQTAR
jgi:peptide deformylase